MSYKSRTVHFEYKNIVHNSYLAALNELHLTLVTHSVNGKANTASFIDVACLRQELYVKWHPLHFACSLRMIIPSH